MKALVLHHSLFGNTKTVAMSLASGLEDVGVETVCTSIDEFNISEIVQYDLIAIGSPTHILKTSKPMMEFLKELAKYDLRGRLGFSFDTRNESKMNRPSLMFLENSAARVIERWMKRMKMSIIMARESAIVYGREGPLMSGGPDRFIEVGREIGKLVAVLKPEYVS